MEAAAAAVASGNVVCDKVLNIINNNNNNNSIMAADAAMDTTCPSPELGDSRKRPLDDGTDDGTSKRSHFSTNDDIHFHDHYTLSYGTIHAKSSSSSSGSDLPPIAQPYAGSTIAVFGFWGGGSAGKTMSTPSFTSPKTASPPPPPPPPADETVATPSTISTVAYFLRGLRKSGGE
uniref:Uncharacterized protein n=1 Tax=Anopheles farauti TaxID=69004 RepID=A0A182QI78_9DIPT